jgi:hypothetical protein
MKKHFTNNFINKHIKNSLYLIWELLGKQKMYGITFIERYEKMEDVKNQLEKSFLKLKKEKPHLVKDLQIEE